MAVSELINMPKRSRVARKQKALARIERVSELLAKGYSVSYISKDLFGTDKQTLRVYQWINRLTKYTEKRILDNTTLYISNMSVGYQQVINTAWESWIKSHTDHKGEPRSPQVVYLDRVLAAMEGFRKLHGLDKTVPKDESNTKGAQGLDWDSLTARKSLSSVTVNINGNAPSNGNVATSLVSQTVVEKQQERVSELKDAVEQRIEELHRRAEEKAKREEQESTSSLQDEPVGRQEGRVIVTQPVPNTKKIIKVKKPIPVRRTIIVQDASPLGE